MKIAASILALAFIAVPRPSSADDARFVGVVGPVHGAWLMNGRSALLSQPVPAGATFVMAKGATNRTPSIAIYMLDGRLIKRTCNGDVSCASPFSVDSAGGKDFVDPDILAVTKALARFRVVWLPPAPHDDADIAPTDGVVQLNDDGTLELGALFTDVAHGTYRIDFQRLDPAADFAKGDPVSKPFVWTGDANVLSTVNLGEGLYTLQLRAANMRAIGAPAWIVISHKNASAALAAFTHVSALTATWDDDEASQTFLRAYLATVAAAQ